MHVFLLLSCYVSSENLLGQEKLAFPWLKYIFNQEINLLHLLPI